MKLNNILPTPLAKLDIIFKAVCGKFVCKFVPTFSNESKKWAFVVSKFSKLKSAILSKRFSTQDFKSLNIVGIVPTISFIWLAIAGTAIKVNKYKNIINNANINITETDLFNPLSVNLFTRGVTRVIPIEKIWKSHYYRMINYKIKYSKEFKKSLKKVMK